MDIARERAWRTLRRGWSSLEAETILERRLVRGKPHLRVQWAGTSISEAEWISESNLM